MTLLAAARRIACVLAVALASAWPAFAQAPDAAPDAAPAAEAPAGEAPAEAMPAPEETDARVAALRAIEAALGELEAALDANGLSEGQLLELRTSADALGKQAQDVGPAVESDLGEAQALLAALKPAAGVADDPANAAERDRLSARIAQLTNTAARAELLAARAKQIGARAARQRLTLFAERLLVRSPSPLAPAVIATAFERGPSFAANVAVQSGQHLASAEVAGNFSANAGFILGAVLAALLIGLVLRRYLLDQVRRYFTESEPVYMRRFVRALIVAAVRIILPAIAIAALYVAIGESGLTVGVGTTVLREAAIAAVGVIAAYALARSFVSPFRPELRVIEMDDARAVLWPPLLAGLGVVLAADRIFTALATAYGLASEAVVAVNLVLVTASSALMIFLLARGTRVEAGSGWNVIRRLAVFAAAAPPLLAIAGYYALSRYTTVRLIVSGAIVLLALLVYRLTRDLIEQVVEAGAPEAVPQEAHERETLDARLMGWWVSFAVGGGLLIFVVFSLIFVWGATTADLASWLSGVSADLAIGGLKVSPADILLGIVVFVVGILITRLIQRAFERSALPRGTFDSGVRHSIRAAFGYLGVLIAGFVALSVGGIDLSNLAIVAGALSVGIGFGLQAVVNNFVSGLILLVERPFKVGDWITVGNDSGFITRIKVRATEIQTFDNATIIVPNSDFISGRVFNWTHRDKIGRVILPIGVAYGTDPDRLRGIVIARALEHGDVLADPEPFLEFVGFGDSSLDFKLRVFVRDITRMLRVRSDLYYMIEKTLREAGITIPFPQRDVTLHMAQPPAGAGTAGPA